MTARTRKAGKPGAATRKTSRATKKTQLIRMLRAKTGTDVWAISKKLGWQGHTARAALSGLRKAGYTVAAEKPGAGKPTRYRIAAAPNAAREAGPEAPAHAG